MTGLTVFTTIAFLGAAFMVHVLGKFHGELKRLERPTRHLHWESDLGEWHVLSPFTGGTNLAKLANNPEQIVIIETPHLGSVPLVRTAASVGTRSSGNGEIHLISAPHSKRTNVLNFRK